MKRARGYLFILGGTMFWGLSATIAKLLFTENTTIKPLVLVQMRMTFSCVVLFLILLIWRRDLLRVPLKELYRFALLGVIGGAGANFTYYFAIKEINVATAIILQYLAPVIVLVYAALSKDERITFTKIGASVASLAGCFFAVGGQETLFASKSVPGIIAGFGAAFCWAFTNIWLRRMIHDYNVWTILFYTFLSASLFWLFFNPPWDIIAARYSTTTWGTFFVFAMISILIPHSLYFLGMRFLTASQAIITATFEPIVAIVSAYIILQEILTPVQAAGAVLVIAAIVFLQVTEEQEKLQRQETIR